MNRKFTWLFLFTILLQVSPTTSFATGITNYPKLNSPDFWQQLTVDGDKEMMNNTDIALFNKKIVEKSATVYNLKDYPTSISSEQLYNYLTETQLLTEELYEDGNLISSAYKKSLLDECNLTQIQVQNTIAYGVTLRRTNLRALPSAKGLFSSSKDTEFDLLQETAIDPSEPLIVLHASTSGNFLYVQMRNYRGWIKADDIVQLTYNEWLNYQNPQQFLIVTANKFSIFANNEEIIYQMGTKLPLINIDYNTYTIRIPTKKPDGDFAELTQQISFSAPVYVGYLPYTRNNIIKQSFNFLHDPYGWGGLKNSVDCSSFIANIYRTVGIELPRNADEQELTAGIHTNMENLSSAERQQQLYSLKAGDVLFFNGHTMLYLGMTNDTPFIIHSLGSHTKHYPDGQREKIRTMQVVVSDLSLLRYNGKTFCDSLTSAVSYH